MLAEKAGMSTGIVTTTRATHATPASAYAAAADRDWESDADVKDSAEDDGAKCKDIGNRLAAVIMLVARNILLNPLHLLGGSEVLLNFLQYV